MLMPSGQAQPCPTGRTSSAVVPRHGAGSALPRAAGVEVPGQFTGSHDLRASLPATCGEEWEGGEGGEGISPSLSRSCDRRGAEPDLSRLHSQGWFTQVPLAGGQLYCVAQARCRAYSPECCSLLGQGQPSHPPQVARGKEVQHLSLPLTTTWWMRDVEKSFPLP